MQTLKTSAVAAGVGVWVWVAALTIGFGNAAAQTATRPDKNCKWPTLTTQTLKSGTGQIRLLVAKNPGSKDCRGGPCNMSVEVQSYTKESGAAACCMRAEYAEFKVLKTVKAAVLRWNLVALDKASYVFNPGDGVKITKPPPTPLDFGQPSIDPNGQWYGIPSLNRRVKSFDYDVTIFRKDKDPGGKDSYLACDPYDPLIVNQGE